MPKFVMVMPSDYKRVLQAIQNALASGLSGDDALNAAFEENSSDISSSCSTEILTLDKVL